MRTLTPWTGFLWLVALILSIPLLMVVVSLAEPATEVWQHLARTVLRGYILNSLGLMLGVAMGTIAIGVSTAWLVSLCRFPGRGIWAWALLLPLAAPAYVLAYTYTDLLDFAGPVQSGLRAWFGWGARDYWFPRVRSLGGAIAMLVLVWYPYVYLNARATFLSQSARLLEAGRSLGAPPWRNFWQIALPLARPAIAAGVALALMEALNDYGTVKYFGVNTFTTGIFRTWFGLGERAAAAQLAALTLVFIAAIVLLEKASRGRSRYHQTQISSAYQPLYTLRGWHISVANLVCALPVVAGFVVPGVRLIQMSLRVAQPDPRFWQYAFNSIALATASAVIAIILALLFLYSYRVNPSRWVYLAGRVAALGYAVPGAVIAVGIVIPFGWFDNQMDSFMRASFNISTGLILSGTVVALLFAYQVRFLAVSFGSVEAGLSRVHPNLDEAARSLGKHPLSIIRQVHLPLIAQSIGAGGLIVFVDVIKELPATLLLRPFNFETLAARVYRLASDERLAESAPGALVIVIVGMLPVFLLIWTHAQQQRTDRRITGDQQALRLADRPR